MLKKYLESRRINAYCVGILIFIGLGSVTYGYTAAIIGTTLGKRDVKLQPIMPFAEHWSFTGQPSFIEYSELGTRSNGLDLMSTMNGLFQSCAVIGTLLLPYAADRFGRKWAIAIVSFPTKVDKLFVLKHTLPTASYLVCRFWSIPGG